MASYIYLPLIALIFHVFLFVAFFAYRREEIIRTFLHILIASIFWTAGSALMRANWGDLFATWYHISLAGILMLPYVFFNFISCFLEAKKSRIIELIGLSVIPLYIFNICSNILLAPPQIIVDSSGQMQYMYTPTFAVTLLFLPTGILLLHTLYLCVVSYKENDEIHDKLSPILMAAVIVFIGNMVIMLPVFQGIPFDILSGNIFAFSLFYALYRKRLFKLSTIFSQSTCYVLAGTLTIFLFFVMINPLHRWIASLFYPGQSSDGDVIPIIILFFIVMELIYLLIKKILDGIFIKDEVIQTEILKNFSLSISTSLEKEAVLDTLLMVIKDSLNVRKVYIFLPNSADTHFQVAKSGSPLHEQHTPLAKDNPFIQYLSSNIDLVSVKNFRRTTAYRALWEQEKENICQYEYIVPLRNEHELVGFVTLSKKSGKKEAYSINDLSFLSSVCSIASIGLKNALLYERACREAQTDELTGLLNRKYFRQILDQQYESCSHQVLSLMLINVDDFKLYNQLYGISEGDAALVRIAHAIRSAVDEKGYVARFSGKEFAVILPQYDTLSTKDLAEKIRGLIASINQSSKDYRLKGLTASIGICSIPYGAHNVKQLLENIDMTIYHVKQSGKNAIAVYTEGITDSKRFTTKTVGGSTAYSSYASTIYALTAAIDTKDHYTFQHSENVAYYASELAYAYGLSDDNVDIIREAALLHDVGKIGITEDILNKEGKLTPEEYEIMKGHVENAVSIIRHLPSLDYVIPAVIGHHERYDGTGYPRRISGEDIPLFARILCIADSFDAITSKRSYKTAASVEKGLAIIHAELGRQFDPKLGALFIARIRDGTIKPRISSELKR